MAPWTTAPEGSHNWRFIILMAYLTFVALGCAYALKLNSDANEQLRQQATRFAYQQCVSSNKAKRVVFNLLDLAETRTKQINNPDQTAEQKRQAIQFYTDAKKQISFVKCPKEL